MITDTRRRDGTDPHLRQRWLREGGRGRPGGYSTGYDGRCKGFDFVELPAVPRNAAIRALNGSEIGGRTVNIVNINGA